MASKKILTYEELRKVAEILKSKPTLPYLSVVRSKSVVIASRTAESRGFRATGLFTLLSTGNYMLETATGDRQEATGGVLDDDTQLDQLIDDAVYWLGAGLDESLKGDLGDTLRVVL